ncbi:ABC-type transport system involved in resistance to organic solvents permease component-like protein [Chthoniobacter flavus Ellin428]|uniref:ABC-type transport system involved in resistance to organic solvents permease component-like protein n=1 Tax=Chthoniobacter flavus Ellin428 TaxID=497964 RepID=B4CWS9_9BACT|nr:ABC transporter permease [Chthoniobacter flavus]EDY21871.1 ABC-type transport system involved in resistance to organic solvents permease component-like protein [Chthoniobacter flavus Ellin428]TCO95793.1 ABC-type transporter Mla maintaining outer membrane lipid asymmetry permease subunit MlaE [Chthoniobacter flavus]
MPFERTLEYSVGSLLGAIFSVGARCLPRVLLGRATIVERETVRQILSFQSGTAFASVMTAFIYGLAAAYAVLSNTASPAAFETLVLPQLGGAFLHYVVPFAIANLVVLKGVVGMTSDITSMRASQEVDALEAVGLHPAEMIFAPRALALIVTAPALAVLGVYSACLGAWLVVWLTAGTGFVAFVAAFASSVTSIGMLFAVGKLAITALAMSLISGYFGFVGARAEQGFVGHITTSAVAMAVFSTIVVNLLLSLLTATFHFE